MTCFRGKAQCNACHRDGGPGEDPLFTDFTASNIGTPANPRLPFYSEDHPDARWLRRQFGRVVIRRWRCRRFSHQGTPAQRSVCGRYALAPSGAGESSAVSGADTAQCDKRPSSDFVKAYGHNGYFKSLKAIVHFYNTRDALARCPTHDQAEGTMCWPAPESTAT